MKLFLTGLLLFSATATIHANIITNGDFSNGLAGWTVANAGTGLGGEAQVLTGLGDVTPANSGQFLLLDTGPASIFGSATPTYATLTSNFTLASSQTVTLTFRYWGFSALFTGPGTSPVDTFQVQILPAAGPAIDALSFDTTDSSFAFIANGPVNSPSGASFFDSTPGANFNQSFTLAAGAYSLSFRVANGDSSLFDSGLLIENVSLTGSGGTQIPEPGTVTMMAIGVLGALAVRRKLIH
ncbi:MAG TPA: PEP-CTERM sorting domain-containing protein [Bryobacteraceae bacterium]|nr:PEP-CTERM sorting domain-containing protein [Bryobacteraceae bacterium]